MSGRRPMSGRPLGLALLGAVLSTAMVLLWLAGLAGTTTGGGLYVRTFDYTDAPLEVAIARGDGQAYAAIATDPTLSRPAVFRGGAEEAAYRAQRPLLSYAAWALSGGRSQLVPLALAILFVAGQSLSIAAFATLLELRGSRPALALLLLALPPSLAALQWFGPEALGLGLVMGGLLALRRSGWRASAGAAVLFSLAGLTRESYLVVPLVLALLALVRRNRLVATGIIMAIPGILWLVWGSIVRVRLGSWPWAAGDCRLAERPFSGLMEGSRYWPPRPLLTAGVLLSIIVIICGCIVFRPRDDLTWIVVGFAVLGALMGDCVWRRWEDFSRPLLPLYAFGLLALLGRPDSTTTGLPAQAPSR